MYQCPLYINHQNVYQSPNITLHFNQFPPTNHHPRPAWVTTEQVPSREPFHSCHIPPISLISLFYTSLSTRRMLPFTFLSFSSVYPECESPPCFHIPSFHLLHPSHFLYTILFISLYKASYSSSHCFVRNQHSFLTLSYSTSKPITLQYLRDHPSPYIPNIYHRPLSPFPIYITQSLNHPMQDT